MNYPPLLCAQKIRNAFILNQERSQKQATIELWCVITQNHQIQTEFVGTNTVQLVAAQHGSTGSRWVESLKPPLGSAGECCN